MTSSLVVEPLLGINLFHDLTLEKTIERQLILTAGLNRVEEETGERPDYVEDIHLDGFEIKEEICSHLDYLKRFAVYLVMQNRSPLVEGIYDPADARRLIDKYRDDYYTGKDKQFKHLILPEYPETYYLPLDFHMPVVITEDMFLNMRREYFEGENYNVTSRYDTIIVASAIRLSSELDNIDELLNAFGNEINPDAKFYQEKLILRALNQACGLAIGKNQTIMWKEKAVSFS